MCCFIVLLIRSFVSQRSRCRRCRGLLYLLGWYLFPNLVKEVQDLRKKISLVRCFSHTIYRYILNSNFNSLKAIFSLNSRTSIWVKSISMSTGTPFNLPFFLKTLLTKKKKNYNKFLTSWSLIWLTGKERLSCNLTTLSVIQLNSLWRFHCSLFTCKSNKK